MFRCAAPPPKVLHQNATNIPGALPLPKQLQREMIYFSVSSSGKNLDTAHFCDVPTGRKDDTQVSYVAPTQFPRCARDKYREKKMGAVHQKKTITQSPPSLAFGPLKQLGCKGGATKCSFPAIYRPLPLLIGVFAIPSAARELGWGATYQTWVQPTNPPAPSWSNQSFSETPHTPDTPPTIRSRAYSIAQNSILLLFCRLFYRGRTVLVVSMNMPSRF